MASQDNSNQPGGPWGNGFRQPSDMEGAIPAAQARIKRMMPVGGAHGIIIIVELQLVGLGASTSY